MSGITIDGIDYDVIVTSGIERSFDLKQGGNQGTAQTGREIPDIIGTNYSFTMSVEPNKGNFAAYDAFYQKITEPVEYHTVSVPYGQKSITFQAMILSGTDRLKRKIGEARRWGALKIQFKPIEPQRTEVDTTTYILTFDANGGSGGPEQITSETGSFFIPEIVPGRQGYSFRGWGLSRSGTASYQPGGTFVAFSEYSILYAIWGSSGPTETAYLVDEYGNAITFGGNRILV